MLDRRKEFEISIESFVEQEEDCGTSQISDTHRGSFPSWSWIRCKSASAPRVQESVSATRAMIVEGAEMDDKEARRFRALAARLNYLPGDRSDLLFAST